MYSLEDVQQFLYWVVEFKLCKVLLFLRKEIMSRHFCLGNDT